jgi:hypothetical protein
LWRWHGAESLVAGGKEADADRYDGSPGRLAKGSHEGGAERSAEGRAEGGDDAEGVTTWAMTPSAAGGRRAALLSR